MISESGLVWSMNCESCEDPKNSRTAAAAGLALITSCGMTVSISTEDMRSLMARSMRSRPRRYWFSISSPTERTRRLPRLSMSSISPRPSFISLSTRRISSTSSLRSTRTVSSVWKRSTSPSRALAARRMFIFTRPTADRSKRSSSKNRPENSASAVSSVGGSPGRMTR